MLICKIQHLAKDEDGDVNARIAAYGILFVHQRLRFLSVTVFKNGWSNLFESAAPLRTCSAALRTRTLISLIEIPLKTIERTKVIFFPIENPARSASPRTLGGTRSSIFI